MKKLKQETDLLWKYILRKYFKSFLKCCSERAKEIKWSKNLKFAVLLDDDLSCRSNNEKEEE